MGGGLRPRPRPVGSKRVCWFGFHCHEFPSSLIYLIIGRLSSPTANVPQTTPPPTFAASLAWIPYSHFLIRLLASFVWSLVTPTKFPGSSALRGLSSTPVLHLSWLLSVIPLSYARRHTQLQCLGSHRLLRLQSRGSYCHTRGLASCLSPCSDPFVLSPSCLPPLISLARPSFWWFGAEYIVVQNRDGVQPYCIRVWNGMISGSRRTKNVKLMFSRP